MKNLSSSDLIFFTKRLSFLLRAGIPMQTALSTIVHQSKRSLLPIFETLAKSAERGQGLSSGMSVFPNSFPEYVIQMIRAGEESGTLAEHVSLVATELYRRKVVARKLSGALLYPIIIAIGTVALSFFLVLVIFPKVKKLFQGIKAPLPITTRILIWLSDFMHSYGLLILFLMILFSGIGIFALKKYPKIKTKKDELVLRAPIIGKMISRYCLAAAFRTISIMLKSGIPIEKALRYAGASLGNLAYKNAFESAALAVASGDTLSSSLKKFPELFPETAISMIEIGESSGTLSGTLSYLSAMIDEENEDVSKALLGVVEPALMAAMGLVVGFISLSIITPIYAITQNISR